MAISCLLVVGQLCIAGTFGATNIKYHNLGIGQTIEIMHQIGIQGSAQGSPGWNASYAITDVLPPRMDEARMPNKCAGNACIGYSVSCDADGLTCTYTFVRGGYPLTITVRADKSEGMVLARQSLAVILDSSRPGDNLPFADFTVATAP